jgi:beta-N-acetylhexosaminidase
LFFINICMAGSSSGKYIIVLLEVFIAMRDIFHKFQIPLTKLIVSILIFGFVVSPIQTINAKTGKQDNLPLKNAQNLLAELSPKEKVGQLLLVTFNGIDTTEQSQINSLISKHFIGGVVLQRKNNNFVGGDSTVQSAYDLISDLQNTKWQSTQATGNTTGNSADLPAYIPLFIGASQEGDGPPNSQIISGFTQIPNEMTIGATWNPDLAEQNGEILGNELSNIGINLLLGPSMDVLELPLQEGGEDLGTRTFGGDPYWVGEMGKAFIRGVHQGSANKVAVMAKHFPGRGGSDRPTEEEVATVRKSLEQLKQIELAPFFAVTGTADDPNAITDGLLVSHIRYQGFQGNIRVTTRPVSFDPAALTQILSLPQFSSWRDSGGIIISDDLGSTAVRKFNDPTMLSFDSRQTARNALLAGNDILYVDNFTDSSDKDTYSSIIRTLDYFTQKYSEDPTFAQRVDASVLRILTLKYKLYPNFNINSVVPPESGLKDIGSENQAILDTSQSSAALINPSVLELPNVLPDPPSYQERIIFLMDSTDYQQCSTCEYQTSLAADSLKNGVIRLYGPTAGSQVNQLRLSGYSFKSVEEWLNGIEPPTNFETDFKQANWVVVGLQNIDVNRPYSLAFKHLLAERSELLRNKKIIVFAFNAPYYLDATDLSKVTAYYALYSKSQPFIDLAARILFHEVSPQGTSPVSIPGVGYDLINATMPDPNQVIPLVVDLPVQIEITPESDSTPESLPIQKFKLGDTIPIRTGVIFDHNQHSVPDGTLVRFIIRTETDPGTTQQIEATTISGIARAAYRIPTNGFIEIRVTSEPALVSEFLQLDIPLGEGAGVTAVAPTPIPSSTPVPSVTPIVTQTATPDAFAGNTGQPTFWEWLLVVLIIGIAGSLVYTLGKKIHSIRWGVRWAFCSILGGLISYIYLAGRMPGGEAWLKLTGTTGLLIVVILCMSLGFAVGILWHAVTGRPGN